MELFDSIDKILKFAIDREIEANQLYTDLAQRTENAKIKKVFENFAKEELGHKASLQDLVSNDTTTEKMDDLKIADYTVDVESQPDMNYQDALILAMKKENASFHLYTDLANLVENQTQKDIFLTLAQEEARHKLRFEIEYEDTMLNED